MADDGLIPHPTHRKLRIFALDPSLAAQYATAGISELTIEVAWEPNLKPGPIGEYLEIVDADPASNCYYKPVDLNDQRVLGQNGLAPSETNPQFHQQMAYAVAMATISHFEQALGRVALWASHRERDPDGRYSESFVPRLRIYPHALRERNAYYSPRKKALLFGYFPAGKNDGLSTSDTMVYTALSHDIIAHETTHALLDGVHPRFNEPLNNDVLAFHEAFADIVALFQHFAYPGVLRHQIARTRGNLAEENLLGQLAQQFGRAAGRSRALRDALGVENPKTGAWEPRKPDVNALNGVSEPHARGAILVAAVFGAFMKVYRGRTADLYRIATEGTGVLRAGDIHPDLSNRLADEAARCAQYTLQMCIRAIDYCPPVGITFGDYLRAIVTADYDINRDDPYGYRLAVVETFREWGIHPRGMRSLSTEALLWPSGHAALEEVHVRMEPAELRTLFAEQTPSEPSERATRKGRTGSLRLQQWGLDSDRYATWSGVEENSEALWNWLMGPQGRKVLPALGLVVHEDAIPPTVFRSKSSPRPAVEVHSVRRALRRTPRGALVSDLVVEITQRRRGYFDPEEQQRKDAPGQPEPADEGDFRFRTGCTVLIDPLTMELRRVIRTPGVITDDQELDRVRRFLTTGAPTPDSAFWMFRSALDADEPFAVLHQHAEA